MNKTELRDIVIFLPGIGGSVLQTRNGKSLWAPSVSVAWKFLTHPGSILSQLQLKGDDPELEILDDGIRAVSLVSDVHLIPGLWKIDVYSGISTMMNNSFRIQIGSSSEDDESVANYFEFPYDWRRDNRASAHRLQQFVQGRLHRWRTKTPFKDAKVIFVAHSMGGLVARYYLEVFGGWKDCRALISIGTPYRGSVKAVGFLANGHRVLFSDLTDVVRSFTSVYQLLPRYEMVNENGSFKRVAETEGAIPGINRDRALDALRFHQEIDDAVKARTERGYELIPIVGTWQPTLQSARLSQGKLTVDTAAPTWTEFPQGEGDGTVPRVSAVPIEFSNAWLNTFVAEKHGSLQNNAGILQDLKDRLIQSQVRTDHIRGAVVAPQRPAISFDVEDLYSALENIVLHATVHNIETKDIKKIHAQVFNAINGTTVFKGNLSSVDEEWRLDLPNLPSGTYRVELNALAVGEQAPEPVHDVFVVAEKL